MGIIKRIGIKWMNDPMAFDRWKNNHRLSGDRLPKPVVCIETGIVYPSRRSAEKAIGLSDNAIKVVLDRPNRTAGGYHWVRSVETAAEAV